MMYTISAPRRKTMPPFSIHRVPKLCVVSWHVEYEQVRLTRIPRQAGPLRSRREISIAFPLSVAMLRNRRRGYAQPENGANGIAMRGNRRRQRTMSPDRRRRGRGAPLPGRLFTQQRIGNRPQGDVTVSRAPRHHRTHAAPSATSPSCRNDFCFSSSEDACLKCTMIVKQPKKTYCHHQTVTKIERITKDKPQKYVEDLNTLLEHQFAFKKRLSTEGREGNNKKRGFQNEDMTEATLLNVEKFQIRSGRRAYQSKS